jgi:hypothetical protein
MRVQFRPSAAKSSLFHLKSPEALVQVFTAARADIGASTLSIRLALSKGFMGFMGSIGA